MLFDGKKFALRREEVLKKMVAKLVRVPTLVSFLVGEHLPSELYTKMKKRAAERVGIDFRVERSFSTIERVVRDTMVDGVMIQMPIMGVSLEESEELVAMIPPEKDVDGLRWEMSGIMPATVKAVIAILDEISASHVPDLWRRKFVVVGDRGNVGRPLVHFIKARGSEVIGANRSTVHLGEVVKKAEVVVSCAGRAGLIGADMIADGVVAVDVGIDAGSGGKVAGDMTKEVYEKAGIAVPVPGGVGPVTVVSLLENLAEIAISKGD